MSNRHEDVFDNLREGLNQFTKKVTHLVDEVLHSDSEEGGLRVRTDAYHTTDQFVVEIELPGLRKEEVALEIVDGILSVKGEKKPVEGASGSYYLVQERAYGRFLRSIHLPDDIDPDQVKAKYDLGVLTVRFPRIQVAPASGPDTGLPIE
ncbi:MAG: Hsp20/alpha crystallin family protein [Bacteroidia bacterium]|jgi:HSP20 family protein|nr:Hsp20/alpha crystallin family protein [Bacteroidia bacterium]